MPVTRFAAPWSRLLKLSTTIVLIILFLITQFGALTLFFGKSPSTPA